MCHWGSPVRADAPWTGHRTSDARAAALRGEHAGKPAIWLATDAYDKSRHARLQGLPPSTCLARPRHGIFEMKLVWLLWSLRTPIRIKARVLVSEPAGAPTANAPSVTPSPASTGAR
jgi:hypothetical protein